MFNQPFERELFDGEPWLSRQESKLPLHLQLLVEQQQKRRDTWELPKKEHNDDALKKKFYRFWFFNLW
ncbi:MAG: hypothetical protein KME30_31420 [Iphinoe sp. HA4291-MV1]|jgi:hypothetical protein|nr:hypothetical protein [Iphinoe sp. HA4291-MV1]